MSSVFLTNNKFSLYFCTMSTFLKDAIFRSGKTQREIAETMGVTPQSLNGVLSYNTPKPDTLAAVLLATGWTVEDIRNLRLGDVYEIATPAATPTE